MPKPHVTRTLGPIHFEDLDPHRFEDLVRQLAYDYKQWQSIESTGRGGADDGFDIRAYELIAPSQTQDDEETQEDASHPMEGNLWMIQCKREKELGPKRVKAVIGEAVNSERPPYGYILAASAHFSKAAHDMFRDELRTRGVMEFYLWGAGELEDMLYQPKNDHILFAFFGISLTSRRRSQTTEIRAAVNVKNKLRRVLNDYPRDKTVLIRDLQDHHYPYEDEYKDFDKRPRWKAYSVVDFHPVGLIVFVGEYYAYIDKPNAEWDFTDAVNKIRPVRDNWRRQGVEDKDLEIAVKGFWEQFPRARRATFFQRGFVGFDSIAFVDDKGDNRYDYPHLFVDFHTNRGPFSGRDYYLKVNGRTRETLEGLKRIRIFPKDFPEPSFGTMYKDKSITVGDTTRAALKQPQAGITIYDPGKNYSYLKATDVISVDGTEDKNGKKTLLKVTNVRVAPGKELLATCEDDPTMKVEIESQISRELKAGDTIQIVEALVLYDFQIEQNRPVLL